MTATEVWPLLTHCDVELSFSLVSPCQCLYSSSSDVTATEVWPLLTRCDVELSFSLVSPCQCLYRLTLALAKLINAQTIIKLLSHRRLSHIKSRPVSSTHAVEGVNSELGCTQGNRCFLLPSRLDMLPGTGCQSPIDPKSCVIRLVTQ